VVPDTASSMGNTYWDRLEVGRAKEIVSLMNQMIPPLEYRAELVVFESGSCLICDDAVALYGPAPYSRTEFDASLAGFKTAGRISRAGNMSSGAVSGVFLTPASSKIAAAPVGAAPVAELDSDGDGVPDSRDKCPNTPKGVKVNADGCWELKGVYFDSDKAVITDRNLQTETDFWSGPQLTGNWGGGAFLIWIALKIAHACEVKI